MTAREDALKTAEYNSRRLSRMISQLLDFEKAAMNKMEIRLTRIPVKKVLEELCANFLPAIEEKGLIFIQDFRHQEILLCADRDKFDKIIFNLLSNAVKYTDPGGQIRMTSFLQGNRFHLEVSDTGSGIPKHQHTNIFNQYFRASNAANTNEVGSGIGLMLTKRLVELHQGRISFESEPGYGSRFFFWLPTTLTCTGTDPLPPQTAEPLTDEDDTGRNRKPRLLIAEDHTDLRYYLINNLKEDYHVFSAENGEQALGLTKSIFPDIILSDVMMPKVNGYEFCYEIKSCIETSHIPFILLSALNSDEHKIDGIKTGADIYLEKPFDLALLKSSLESLLLNRERIRDKLLRRELLTESDGVSELDRLFVDKANKVVERHFANPDFSVDAFEREMGMSHAALYRKFKTLMARTPLEFIQEIRMK